MTRVLDWLRAAIGALLETSMRRLRLVGCCWTSTSWAAGLGASQKGPNSPGVHPNRLQEPVGVRASILRQSTDRSGR